MQNRVLPVRLEGPIKVEAEVKATMVGDNGKSAYEIAVAHGYKGTEQEWLDSLKGLQGPQGEPGLKGAPFRYEDFTPEQLGALKGPKGDKGNPFVYADFTTEQLEALKGPKGDKGEDGRDGASATVDNAHQLLLQGNVWCESASVDDELTALIGNMGKPFPRTEFKPLTVLSVVRGQRVIGINGEPHYTVKVVGNDTDVFGLNEAGVGNITIEPLGDDDVKLTYHNFTGDKVGDYTIAGVQTGAAADAEYTENGIVYKLFGTTLKMNIANNTVNGNFNDNPKRWNVTQKVIYANRPSTLKLGDNWNAYGPYYVETPENITFKGFNNNMRLTVATATQATTTMAFNQNTIEWDAVNSCYSNTGDYNTDHL